MAASRSPIYIFGAAYGIAWLHKKLGCPNRVDDPLDSQTLAGFERLLADPSKKKQTIESDHVGALIRSYGHAWASLPSLQMVSLVALGFRAFLRWSSCVTYATHMSVFVDRRKNAQFRQRSVVKVARLPFSSCPVKLCGKHQPCQSLFCICKKLGTGYKLR